MNTARYVADIERRALAFLNDRCTLWREAEDVVDAFGMNTPPEWAVIASNVPCRAYGSVRRLSETIKIVGEAEVPRDEMMLALPKSIDTSEVKRVTIGEQHYRVKAKPPKLTDNVFRTLILETW